MTVGQLSRAMTERELGQWARYASHTPLPTRRMEFYLAQVAMSVIASRPGFDPEAQRLSSTDFMLFERVEDEDQEDDGNEARAFFGFAPVK